MGIGGGRTMRQGDERAERRRRVRRRMDGYGGGRGVVIAVVRLSWWWCLCVASLAVLAVLRGTGSTLGAAFLVGFVADSKAAELAIASRQASK